MSQLLSVLLFIIILASTAYATEGFIDNGDGTVTDSETNLMWEKDVSWSNSFFGIGGNYAYGHCKSLNLANYNDWKIPDIHTFEDLYSKKSSFPEKLSGYYWSEGYGAGPGHNLIFNMDEGKKYQYLMSKSLPVRCVRITKSVTNLPRYELKTIVEWSKYGFQPEEIVIWGRDSKSKAGKGSYHYPPISAAEAFSWKSIGYTPEIAMECIMGGFKGKAKDAKIWNDLSFSCKEALDWKRINVTPQEAAEWKNIPLDSNVAKNWIEAGFTVKDASDWFAIGMTPAKAREWKSKGFTSNEALPWKRIFERPSEATKWKEYEFSPNDAKTWNELKFSADNAIEWKNSGKTAKEASKWVGYKPATASKLGKICVNGIGSFSEIVTINPFDTDGKCYRIAAPILQLLNRTQALYSLYNMIFFIDFKKDSAPMNYFDGFVLGKGAYKYIDVNGSQRIVPNFTRITLD